MSSEDTCPEFVRPFHKPFRCILIVLDFSFLIVICELVDDLDHVNHYVHVLVAEQTDETFNGSRTDDLGVCKGGRLCERKKGFKCEVEVSFRVNESM